MVWKQHSIYSNVETDGIYTRPKIDPMAAYISGKYGGTLGLGTHQHTMHAMGRAHALPSTSFMPPPINVTKTHTTGIQNPSTSRVPPKKTSVDTTSKKNERERRLAILSKTALILNRLKEQISKGTLQDYLEHEGAPKIKLLENMLNNYPNLSPKLEPTTDPDVRVSKLIAHIDYHLNAGTLERSLKKDSHDALKLRSLWHGFLLNVPNQTREQILNEKEQKRAKKNKRKKSIISIASFITNGTLVSGALLAVFMHVSDVDIPNLTFNGKGTTHSDSAPTEQFNNTTKSTQNTSNNVPSLPAFTHIATGSGVNIRSGPVRNLDVMPRFNLKKEIVFVL